jgi:hypothetical protein
MLCRVHPCPQCHTLSARPQRFDGIWPFCNHGCRRRYLTVPPAPGTPDHWSALLCRLLRRR